MASHDLVNHTQEKLLLERRKGDVNIRDGLEAVSTEGMTKYREEIVQGLKNVSNCRILRRTWDVLSVFILLCLAHRNSTRS